MTKGKHTETQRKALISINKLFHKNQKNKPDHDNYGALFIGVSIKSQKYRFNLSRSKQLGIFVGRAAD